MQSSIQSHKFRDIKVMQELIGKQSCNILLFAHALTGCDTIIVLCLEKVNLLRLGTLSILAFYAIGLSVWFRK